jgi:formylmethanofuran dehydrogenase subunit E
MEDFEVLLESSAEAHGHLCPGQVVGVRMAMLGCRMIGLEEPRRHDQIKKLIVYVEMDRCTADAVAHVTGVKLGRRSLKFMDYGIMAATFVNLATGEAYRVVSTEAARSLASAYAPEIADKSLQQINECDLPGPTRYKAFCSRCGQVVRDQREVIQDGSVLCKPCAKESYFTDAAEVTWPDMNWKPECSVTQSRKDAKMAETNCY